MDLLYISLIFEILIYKLIYKFIFVTVCYSKPLETNEIKEELKKWKFHIDEIIYYLVSIIAILKPLLGEQISINYFLFGLIPIAVSLFLYLYCFFTKTYLNSWAIDFFFIEGLAIQTNSWLCSLLGFIYLFIKLIVNKIKNR
jgi:hypothetical protein